MNRPWSCSVFGETSLSTLWSPSQEGTSGGTKQLNGTCTLFPEEILGGSKGLWSSLPLNSEGMLLFSAHHP